MYCCSPTVVSARLVTFSRSRSHLSLVNCTGTLTCTRCSTCALHSASGRKSTPWPVSRKDDTQLLSATAFSRRRTSMSSKLMSSTPLGTTCLRASVSRSTLTSRLMSECSTTNSRSSGLSTWSAPTLPSMSRSKVWPYACCSEVSRSETMASRISLCRAACLAFRSSILDFTFSSFNRSFASKALRFASHLAPSTFLSQFPMR
mmetsp:Transcript_89551/g.253810  ORF Transcript_89551/g.253810 Transcript_89551/m.253810 type:complete len:203 (-) Transcript_89551:29-637(-)